MSNTEQQETSQEEPPLGPPKWWLHLLLFVLALASMTVAGMQFTGQDVWLATSWQSTKNVGQALAYAVCLMGILFTHEMGHYLHCKREDIEASPPFFIPGLPIPGVGMMPLFGTFGAFIKMQIKPLSAIALLRVGAWGPIAGFIVAVPVLLLGFSLSTIKPVPPDASTLQLGDNLIVWLMEKIFFPSIPKGHDVFLHPVAMAGWTGAFFTGFNLIPIGQLDGGHICYSIFGKRYNKIAWGLWAILAICGALWFPGWLLLCGFLFLTGPKHPNIVKPEQSTAPATLAIISAVIFALTFTPMPFEGLGLWSWLQSSVF